MDDNNGKPWQVTSIARTKDAWYRYSIQGHNHYTGEPFSWSVPNIDDERYDLSGVTVPEAA